MSEFLYLIKLWCIFAIKSVYNKKIGLSPLVVVMLKGHVFGFVF